MRQNQSIGSDIRTEKLYERFVKLDERNPLKKDFENRLDRMIALSHVMLCCLRHASDR